MTKLRQKCPPKLLDIIMFDIVVDASIEDDVLSSREDFGNWTIRFPDSTRAQT